MFRERITEIFRLRSGITPQAQSSLAEHMNRNRQTAARTVLVGVADEFDKMNDRNSEDRKSKVLS